MVSIIGLLDGKAGLYRSIQKLEEAGLTENQIHIISQENKIRKLLYCQPKGVVSRHVVMGASIGLAIFGIFGLLTGLYHYTLLDYKQVYLFSTSICGILSGILVGGALGYLVGISALEKEIQLFLEGTRAGRKVISIQTEQGNIDEVKHILEQENAFEVRVLQLPDPD